MYKKEDVDKYGVSKLYLRNKALSHREVSAFAVITFTFGLIVLVAVWNLVLQETTMSSCAVEDGTSCFPLLSDNSSTADLTISTDQPVSDCSYWKSDNVSNFVEGFRCFQLRFDLIVVLSRFGGLLSIMLLVLRVTFSLALAIIDTFFETFVQSPDEKQSWSSSLVPVQMVTQYDSIFTGDKLTRVFLCLKGVLVLLLLVSMERIPWTNQEQDV